MFQQRNRNSHMRISALEDLIDGDIGSRRRKLLAQVRRVFKLANPVTDAYFQSLDETHQQHKAHLEASWTIHSVSLLKRDRRRLKHAQNCLVVGVAASQGLRERKVLSYYQSEDDDEMQVHF